MSASFILCERTSRWAAAFRREMRKVRGLPSLARVGKLHAKSRLAQDSRPPDVDIPSPSLILQEVRSLPHCQRELDAFPFSVVALEVLPQNLAAVAKVFGDWSRRFPHARFVALVARGLEGHELLLREAGAIHVISSPRSLSPLLRLIGRHLARAPKKEEALEAAIWGALPWG